MLGWTFCSIMATGIAPMKGIGTDGLGNLDNMEQFLSDKLPGSCRCLGRRAGGPVNLIRNPVVKPLVPPSLIVELEIGS